MKCYWMLQGYSFYRFYVIKRENQPGGGGGGRYPTPRLGLNKSYVLC